MTVDQAKAWCESSLRVFVDYRVNLNSVRASFKKKTSIRPYSKKLFDLCANINVPTIIFSAGIQDIIEMWTKTFRINPSLILSNRLISDEKGTVTGWIRESLIHTHNKRETAHPELFQIRKKRPNVIVIGDSLEDANMAGASESSLKIRINASEEGRNGDSLFNEKSFEKFDLVAKPKSLSPIVHLVNLIAGKK